MEDAENKQEQLDKVIELVESSELASIKGTITGIVEIINNPRSNAKDLKEVIQVDPPLTAKVLRVANSAFYASPRKINEIDQAVIWIGFDMLKEIALSQKVCEIFKGEELNGSYSRGLLWKHSLAVALLAKMIYRREFGERGENAYAAGLMHDIGIIVEDQFYKPEFTEIISASEDSEVILSEKENEMFGYNHADLGQVLTSHWSLPADLVAAIGHHHNPQGVALDYAKLSKTLYIADCLTHEYDIGFSGTVHYDEVNFRRYADNLELKSHALKSLVTSISDELKKMEDKGFFEV